MKLKNFIFHRFRLSLPVLFWAGFSLGVSAQNPCSELFFSEYLEGASGNNKCVEIYNPTSAAIDLAAEGYKVLVYSNGSSSSNTPIALSGTIPANGVFLLCNNQSNTTILGLANQVSSGLSHNGDDAIALVKGASNTPVDIFGRIGNDPGTSWSAGSLSTANQILRRNAGVSSGITSSPTGTGSGAFTTLATEWENYPDTDYTGFGNHTSTACAPMVSCVINSLTLSNISACNDNGTPLTAADDYFTASIVVTYSGKPSIGTLNIGGGANLTIPVEQIGGSSYTFSDVVFASNGGNIVLTASFSEEGACTLTNLSAGTAPSPCSVIPPCTLPFFSEYVEGSGNNKCLEIYNPTGTPLDLSANNYRVRFYFNGSTSAGLTINLSGVVPAGGTHVVCTPSAAAEFLAYANQAVGNSWFNGDDAIALENNDGIVDVIGQIGFDPGTAWFASGVSTLDQTLRRMPHVTSGDNDGSNPFNPSEEWVAAPQNASSTLGYHISSCQVGQPGGWAFSNPGCNNGGLTTFSGNSATQTSACFNPNSGSDDLTFAFSELCGNGEITAQISSISGLGFAGLMMRETASPSSKYVWMMLRNSNLAFWSIRNTTGAAPSLTQSPRIQRTWLKLTRMGNLFRGYLSSNGQNWQLVFQSSFNMESCLLVGIATHSHVDGATTTANFNHINLSGGSYSLSGITERPDQGISETITESDAPVIPESSPLATIVPNAEKLIVWPNPAGDHLEVRIPKWETNELIELQVYDMQGKALITRRLEVSDTQFTLLLDGLSPGMYLLSLRAGSNLETVQFIKQ